MGALSREALDLLYLPASEGAVLKSLSKLDKHCSHFISKSPFLMLGAAGADGSMDVSPRGGSPGFVHVKDANTLLIPDRPGNNRLDVLRNILDGSGQVGMVFLIPGLADCLRVNGRADLTDDQDLAQNFIEFGKAPAIIIRVTVEEAFLHCPKAIIRSKIWSEEAKIAKGEMPSMLEMLRDQVAGLSDMLPSQDQMDTMIQEGL